MSKNWIFLILFLTLYFLLTYISCSFKPIIGTHPTPLKDTLIESSSPIKPNWLTEIPKGCFLGSGEGRTEKEAKESAISDMLKNYAITLGIDLKVLTKIHQEEIKRITEEVIKTKRVVITELEALSMIITAGSEIRKIYWEKRAKNNEYIYYKYWVLGEVEERFMEEERQRIKELKNIEELKRSYANSDLNVEVYEKKGRYKSGEKVEIEFEANDNVYVYLFNFYGEGKVEFLNSERLGKGEKGVLNAEARYSGKGEEIIKVIASDKPLDIERALKEIYPKSIIKNLRSQANELKARYCEKSISILIEEK